MENPLKKNDIDALAADIERLKKDLAKTMEHVKSATVNGAMNGAAGITDYISDEAEALYKAAQKKGQRAQRAINKHVEEQPVQSLLLAFAAGFLFSRLTDRNS